jgi:predicted nucleic acid-binding protein
VDILIDTNILISVSLFPNENIMRFFSFITSEHNLFICSYSFDEATRVINRKYPEKKGAWDHFITKFGFTPIITPSKEETALILGGISVRDKDDNPILASAITADVDILITGDHDFDELCLDRPEIMNIRKFMDTFYRFR